MKQKIVVDTNIVFSAILNPSSKIARIILGSKNYFQLYTCDFLKIELFHHREKILKYAKLSTQELQELEFLLFKNINFINENILPKELILKTEKLLRNVDVNDTPFVALTIHLDAKLWTGDKKLADGIENKNLIATLSTLQILDLLSHLENE